MDDGERFCDSGSRPAAEGNLREKRSEEKRVRV